MPRKVFVDKYLEICFLIGRVSMCKASNCFQNQDLAFVGELCREVMRLEGKRD